MQEGVKIYKADQSFWEKYHNLPRQLQQCAQKFCAVEAKPKTSLSRFQKSRKRPLVCSYHSRLFLRAKFPTEYYWHRWKTDVSDPPFRAVCKENGADLMYTEFISSEALIRDAAKSVAKLDIFEYEKPIGIQIFGHDIEVMRESVEITERVQPDIIDINYGCPVKKVTCKGAGAGILQDIPKMVKMTAEMVKATTLPVTVKTRLGWDDNTKYIVEVAERLQDVGIRAIAIHGRTRKQMYKGDADWTLIGKIKDNPRMNIPVFGNGDVDSPQKAKKMRQAVSE